MAIWKHGPRVRPADLTPGQKILMPLIRTVRVVEVARVWPIDDIYTAIYTTGGTRWDVHPRLWITTVVLDEDMSGPQSA